MAETLIKAGYNSVYGTVLRNDIGANAFYASLKAEIESSEQVWLPLGTTPESYPQGTFAESLTYVIADLKKTLLQVEQKNNLNLSRHGENNSIFFSPPVRKEPDLEYNHEIDWNNNLV